VHASFLRLSSAAALALGLTGCYVVPVQVEQGQQPVYAYVPIQDAPRAANASARPAQQPAMVAAPANPSNLHVRLYPLNDIAAQWGPLQGVVTDNLAGRGTFSVHAGGEQMQGEATRVPDHYPGFGRVITDALGAMPRSAAGESRRGVANAYGSRGAYANCEYLLAARAMGTGACVFSNGAKYQIHFGG